MTEREMYLGAIKVLQKRGWCRQSHRGERVCILGAISTSLGRKHWSDVADMPALYSVVGDSGGDWADEPYEHIYIFNDQYCESADDAIAALQIAADLAA